MDEAARNDEERDFSQRSLRWREIAVGHGTRVAELEHDLLDGLLGHSG